MAIVIRITLNGEHKFLDITKMKRSIVFGRSDDCDYTIKDDGCSGSHIEFSLGATGLKFLDLDSKNGSILNGKKVSKGNLYIDDLIQIGDVFLELHTESLVTIEKERLKNTRPSFEKSTQDLTIPDVKSRRSESENLVSEKKARHGFDELTNITNAKNKPKISELIKMSKKKKN